MLRKLEGRYTTGNGITKFIIIHSEVVTLLMTHLALFLSVCLVCSMVLQDELSSDERDGLMRLQDSRLSSDRLTVCIDEDDIHLGEYKLDAQYQDQRIDLDFACDLGKVIVTDAIDCMGSVRVGSETYLIFEENVKVGVDLLSVESLYFKKTAVVTGNMVIFQGSVHSEDKLDCGFIDIWVGSIYSQSINANRVQVDEVISVDDYICTKGMISCEYLDCRGNVVSDGAVHALVSIFVSGDLSAREDIFSSYGRIVVGGNIVCESSISAAHSIETDGTISSKGDIIVGIWPGYRAEDHGVISCSQLVDGNIVMGSLREIKSSK